MLTVCEQLHISLVTEPSGCWVYVHLFMCLCLRLYVSLYTLKHVHRACMCFCQYVCLHVSYMQIVHKPSLHKCVMHTHLCMYGCVWMMTQCVMCVNMCREVCSDEQA